LRKTALSRWRVVEAPVAAFTSGASSAITDYRNGHLIGTSTG
jgi:hypothetical protein